MIEGISGRCSTAPFPESFSEERCQREVVKAFNTQAVKSLFFKDTQPILDEVMKIRSVMVKELFRSGRTQKQPFDRMMIKVRLDARRGVETLIYKLLQRGTFKSVYVVVCCSGEGTPVYAYAKSNFLHEDRKNLTYLKERVACYGARVEEMIEGIRGRIALTEQQFQTEAQVSSALPGFSVDAQLVYKRKNPATIKGMKMEYASGGSLFNHLAYEGQRTPVLLLVRIASRVCSLVAKAHQMGFFHGDIKPENVLLRKKPEGSVPLSTLALCDFSSAIRMPSDEPCARVKSTFPPPEVFLANEEKPSRHVFEEDLWALGVTVFGIIYGMRNLIKWNDYFRAKESPWSWEEILRHDCFPQEKDYSYAARIPTCVTQVIGTLMRKEPGERMTAETSAEQLEEIAKKMV